MNTNDQGIYFYQLDKPFGELSNLYPSPINIALLLDSQSFDQTMRSIQSVERDGGFYKISIVSMGQTCEFELPAYAIEGIVYPTVEHWFQCLKTLDLEKWAWLYRESDPFEIARKGKSPSILLRADWEQIKDSIMFIGLLAKFTQNTALWKVLDSTGSNNLYEDAPKDAYWGLGPADTSGKRNGKNTLGHLLVKVRTCLRANEAP
ncbi:hypothetical protein KSF_107960 [Reticulibacter mediterranei]|uniref:NADAR domain-containing protein n=1 Tax=Reticulibacter mediterranei TaxID=2778369 RepID=A0A8J3N9G2_9CHLR|nr:NADAR family protein [Reticulibacter mediterranei]GHP00749.1 hypothetical protein KSF_107960 [Reticulibacter mediterranei]